MSLSDPIADMLTRIRNAVRINSSMVNVKSSKICKGIANVLKEEGYIEDYDVIDDNKQGILRINLKYTMEGDSVIDKMQRTSRPGKRRPGSRHHLCRTITPGPSKACCEDCTINSPLRRRGSWCAVWLVRFLTSLSTSAAVHRHSASGLASISLLKTRGSFGSPKVLPTAS